MLKGWPSLIRADPELRACIKGTLNPDSPAADLLEQVREGNITIKVYIFEAA